MAAVVGQPSVVRQEGHGVVGFDEMRVRIREFCGVFSE